VAVTGGQNSGVPGSPARPGFHRHRGQDNRTSNREVPARQLRAGSSNIFFPLIDFEFF